MLSYFPLCAPYRTIFLAQEYMKGGTLKSVILKQMINRTSVVYSFVQALQWCIHIASALEAMHTSSPMIIHRDLKSDNILLTDTSKHSIAKIADLGLHALVEKQEIKTEKIDGPDARSFKQTKVYEVVVQARLSRSTSSYRSGARHLLENDRYCIRSLFFF